MASGKQLLHDEVRNPVRVLLINLEDKRNTMEKRIAAVMRHHKLKPEDIGDRLIVMAKGEIKIKVAKQVRTGAAERNVKIVEALINLVKEKHIDVVSIDSFIRTHSVNENDNSAIEGVVECFEDIALTGQLRACTCGITRARGTAWRRPPSRREGRRRSSTRVAPRGYWRPCRRSRESRWASTTTNSTSDLFPAS